MVGRNILSKPESPRLVNIHKMQTRLDMPNTQKHLSCWNYPKPLYIVITIIFFSKKEIGIRVSSLQSCMLKHLWVKKIRFNLCPLYFACFPQSEKSLPAFLGLHHRGPVLDWHPDTDCHFACLLVKDQKACLSKKC